MQAVGSHSQIGGNRQQNNGWELAGDAALGRLEPFFADDMRELRETARSSGLPLEAIALAYETVVASTLQMCHKSAIEERFGSSPHTARAAIRACCDHMDLWSAKDGNYRLWYVRASEFLAEMCDHRRISLQKYRVMTPTLHEFQEEVADYFMVRRGAFREPDRTLTSVKTEYVGRLAERYYPTRPLDECNTWSDHIAAKYIRTAQDEIMQAYALDYW